MRALLAALLLLSSVALAEHAHAAPGATALEAACAVCIAAHGLVADAAAPLEPAVAPLAFTPRLAAVGALPDSLDTPAAVGRAPPLISRSPEPGPRLPAG